MVSKYLYLFLSDCPHSGNRSLTKTPLLPRAKQHKLTSSSRCYLLCCVTLTLPFFQTEEMQYSVQMPLGAHQGGWEAACCFRSPAL